MAASATPLHRLHRAFEVFVDAVANARLAAGNEVVERELRFQTCPEDRIMERFIERGVNLRTTVQESLMWLGLLPEARGLQAEWIEYKRKLSAYPAVRRFFAGFDRDSLYADRCYASITYVMLDDNRYWRATQPFPPSLPPTLEKLSRAIFDLDVGAVAAAKAAASKKRKPETSIMSVDDTSKELTALRDDCLQMLDAALHQSETHFKAHRAIVTARAVKFDEVFAVVDKARIQLQEADDELGLLLAPLTGNSIVSEYTNGVFDECVAVLAGIPFKETFVDTTLAALAYLKQRGAFVEPQLEEHVFTHHRQVAFEHNARRLLVRALDGAASSFHTASGMVISAKATAVFGELRDTATSVSDTFRDAVEISDRSMQYEEAASAYQTADAWTLARLLWTAQIVPGDVVDAGGGFDRRSVAALRERLAVVVAGLGRQPAELRKSAHTHASTFLRRRTEAAADISRMTVNDGNQSNVREYLRAFIKNLAETVLPSLRRGKSRSVETEANKHPPVAPTTPVGVTAAWPVDLRAFHEIRIVMLELAKEIKTTDQTQQLVEVLRIESLGRAGHVPSFEVVWAAVARLWVLLLAQEQKRLQQELLLQSLTPPSPN